MFIFNRTVAPVLAGLCVAFTLVMLDRLSQTGQSGDERPMHVATVPAASTRLAAIRPSWDGDSGLCRPEDQMRQMQRDPSPEGRDAHPQMQDRLSQGTRRAPHGC